MTRRAAFLPVLALLILAPTGETQAAEKVSPYYAEITAMAAKSHPADVVAKISSERKADPAKLYPGAEWLRDHSISQANAGEIDAAYFLAYSDAMAEMAAGAAATGNAQDQASLLRASLESFYIYEMLATVDAARCVDPTAAEGVRRFAVAPHIRQFQNSYSGLTEADFVHFAQAGAGFEEKMRGRPPSEYVCSLGADKYRDLMKQPGVKTKIVEDATKPGGSYTAMIPPDGYHYMPLYHSDADWNPRRVAARAALQREWDTRLKQLKKQ